MKRFIRICVMAVFFASVNSGCASESRASNAVTPVVQVMPEPDEDSDQMSETAPLVTPFDDWEDAESDHTEESPPVPEPIDYESIQPNEIGSIIIIMYHGITVQDKSKNVYERTLSDFYSDLKNMYDDGYRLISMQDLVDNNIRVPAGYTPVILTFDDGWPTAFSMIEKDGELVPTPDCAVDAINSFAEEYPDFGKAAVFYINGNSEPFQGAGTRAERLAYLRDNGYEVGNHTYSHASLRKLDAEGAQKEIGRLHNMIMDISPDYTITTLAYPYGHRASDEEVREYALKGEFEGRTYEYALAIREGVSGASAAPNHVDFDTINIPRVRGSDNANTDLGWSLRYYRENRSALYISDGDPNTISVPEKYKDKVNMDSLGDKTLNIY